MHERKAKLGGLCASENHDGVDVHLFGPHVLHTNSERVWSLVNSIAPFRNLRARACLFSERFGHVPIPINLTTITTLTGASVKDSAAMCLHAQKCEPRQGESLADWCVRALPQTVAEECVLSYSAKVWGVNPDALPASLFRRLPVYADTSTNYHIARFSGVPVDGWDAWFKRALADVALEYGHADPLSFGGGPVIYTGSLDEIPGAEVRYHTARFSVIRKPRWTHPEPILHLPGASPFYRATCYTALGGVSDARPAIVGVEQRGSDTRAYPLPFGGRWRAEQIVEELWNCGILCAGRLATYRYAGLSDCAAMAFECTEKILQKIY